MSDTEDSAVDIMDSPDYGALLVCRDIELADELEDFLTESCFVFFSIKMFSDSVSIYFGQAGSVDKVKALYGRFVAGRS